MDVPVLHLGKTGGASATAAGTELRVTVSMGIAQARPRELDAQGILRDADAAMYAAKAAGRNRWELAGEPRSPVPPSWEATEELSIL